MPDDTTHILVKTGSRSETCFLVKDTHTHTHTERHTQMPICNTHICPQTRCVKGTAVPDDLSSDMPLLSTHQPVTDQKWSETDPPMANADNFRRQRPQGPRGVSMFDVMALVGDIGGVGRQA